MKFLTAVLFIACAALAVAEVHWDENGQYKLVDTEPLALRYTPEPIHAPISYAPISYDPINYAPLRYYSPYSASMRLREYKPFVYSYKQVIE